MQGILWWPDCRPADIDPTPDSTDVIAMLREREGRHGVGVVVASGSSVLSMRPGDVIRFPMLDLTDRAASCLIGFAKVPSEGNLLVRIPLAEYNADVVEPAPSRPDRAGAGTSNTPVARSWQALLHSGDRG
jgi:hypothetical protein